MKKVLKIASLACSYNRLNKTASFLKTLLSQPVPEGFSLDVYLLDDNSPDGTAAYVQENFPSVQVIKGSGSLFWAGGMRTLWQEVLKRGEYDFYLLFNDDVALSGDALQRLLSAYYLSNDPANIILGTVLDSDRQTITYGGQKITNKLTGQMVTMIPDPVKLRGCEVGNANIMLVDKTTVNRIGILPGMYTHGIADYDYTLTAVENGVKVWIAPGYYGCCDNDHGLSWLPQSTPLKKRIDYLYSPKGLAYKQHMLYVKRHFPFSLPLTHVKFWVKTLFPVIYDVFKKDETVRVLQVPDENMTNVPEVECR